MKKIFTSLFTSLVFLAFLTNLSAQTIYEIVQQSTDHTTLEVAIDAAGLDAALSGDGPLTLFAPTDAAFAALPPGTIDALLGDPTGALTDVLLYHVVGADVQSNTLFTGLQAGTLNGANILVVIKDGDAYINQAIVTVDDIPADNGVVHVIDAVITPPTSAMDVIQNSPIHTILESLLVAAELDDDVASAGPFTIFAPVDEAFAEYEEDILAAITNLDGLLPRTLLTHVFSGTTLAGDLTDGQILTALSGYEVGVEKDGDEIYLGFSEAEVIVGDVTVPNGVIHIVDSPIFPAENTVADVVIKDDNLSTLETAVTAAGLVPALQNEDAEFTIFAPENAAFDALDPAALTALLADPMGELANILTYHVVADPLFSTELKDGDELETLQGQTLKVTVDANGTFVNGVKIIDVDYLALNGNVHIIEGVLIPAEENTVVDVIVNSDVHNTLEAAVSAAGLIPTLSGDGPFTVFAPTDEAFAALGQETIDNLLADPMGQLTTILTYHVVGGTVLAADLSNGPVTMLSGEDIDVNIDNGVVINGTAMVTMADIPADNGVVHVLNAVLIPASVGTNDLLPADFLFQLAPNPTTDIVNIRFGDLADFGSNDLLLFDQLGRLIKSEKNVSQSFEWNLNDLAKGQYFLKLITEEGAAIRTLIVQ